MMRKKVLSAILTIAMLISPVGLSAARASTDSPGETIVTGKVMGQFIFKNSEKNWAINWISQSKQDGETWIKDQMKSTTDQDKLELLSQGLAASKKIDVNNMFKDEPDGTVTLTFKMPDLEINVDGQSTITDENGNYTLRLSVGSHDAKIYSDSSLLATRTITAGNQSSNSLADDGTQAESLSQTDIYLTATTDQIAAAMNNMSGSTVTGQSIYLPSYFGYSASSFGTWNGSRYSSNPQVKTAPSGSGVDMYFIDTDGTVSCNKADTSFAQTANFPLDIGSDCAKSIALGTLFLTEPSLPYSMSAYCVDESLSNVGMGDSNSARYCNRQIKSDGHWNCSWFNGIGDDERLHLHDGSNAVHG